jgi:predicted membrane-bound spermidine synthase
MVIFVFLGLVSSLVQLVILREFTFSIAKNEFSFVLSAGFWILFCSLGSLIGKRAKKLGASSLSVLMASFFCFTVCFIHLAKLLVGLAYYEAASLGFILVSSIILIGPNSFLVGYSFSRFSNEYLENNAFSKGIFAQFFGYEAVGFFLGGILFSLFLSKYRNPFYFAFLPAIVIIFSKKIKIKNISWLLTIVFLGSVLVFSFPAILKQEFMGADILFYRGSSYGPFVLARKSGVESLYANGVLTATSEDKAWNEEFIHTGFSAVDEPKNILFIGPYFTGHLEEILKYNIDSVECIDANPAFLDLSAGWNRLNPLDTKKINFFVDDPRLYIRKNNKKYDCIFMNIAVPSSLAFNRYFSREFFGLIREHLDQKGIFCFYIPSKRDILSPQFSRFNSCIINTLNSVFKNIFFVPSDSMIIIASDSKPIFDYELVKNFSEIKIPLDYFTIYQFKDNLDPSHRTYIASMLDKKIGINSDFYPRGFLYYSLLEQKRFYPQLSINIEKARYWIIVAFIMCILPLSLFIFLSKKKYLLLSVSTVGFTSFGLSSLLFMIFQVYSGALFWKMGVLVGLFMLGLACGAFLINLMVLEKSFKRQNLFYFYVTWVLFILSLVAAIKSFRKIFYLEIIFYIYACISGFLTGAVYPITTSLLLESKNAPKNISITIYAADLAGAFLGTCIFSIFFIPFLGISLSLILLTLLVSVFALRSVFSWFNQKY